MEVDEQLTTRQVAASLGVSESSVKRWCNSGVIPTVRTVGGHRRIPMSAFLRFLADTNRQVQFPVEASNSDKANLDSLSIATPTEMPTKEQLLVALEKGDEEACRELLGSAYAISQSFAIVADEIIAATFHMLGERWCDGSVDIYQERRGCEICGRLVHEFRRMFPKAPQDAPLALGGSPAGDHYGTPSRLIELVLQENHWQSMNLGANLPLSTIAAAVHDNKPQMLWLSVSYLENPQQFAREYQSFHADLPSDLFVIVGGRALTDELRPNLTYTGHCDNMQQFASLAAALHSKRFPLVRT